MQIVCSSMLQQPEERETFFPSLQRLNCGCWLGDKSACGRVVGTGRPLLLLIARHLGPNLRGLDITGVVTLTLFLSLSLFLPASSRDKNFHKILMQQAAQKKKLKDHITEID